MIRRVRPDDVDLFRQVRLRALADAPSAFGSTYAAERALPRAHWVDRTTRAAASGDLAVFLAFDDTDCVGLAGGKEDDLGADRQLISMWVDASHRGTAVAAGLVDAVVEWARGGGARSIGLWVTRGNDRAQTRSGCFGCSEPAAQKTNGISIFVDRWYAGYWSGNCEAMNRCSTNAL